MRQECPECRRWGLLESLPEAVRERALVWERHVREVETGWPGEPGAAGPPRAEYDPRTRTLAQREEAKAAELSAAGLPASVVTVRRMRARYRREGVWGLVDHRATRPRSTLGRADERVVAALLEVLETGRERSSGTLGRLRVYTGRLLDERYGDGVVPLPPAATFNRLAHALADGRGLLGSARQRRWRSARPAPPFVPTTVMAPGELVMLDSTVLDAFVVLDDGVVERPELTIALDVATRTICAAVLRAKGTRSVDAAQLLAQMMVPAPMRPGWVEALAMEHSVVPYERLLSVDARLEGAAARPVIIPQTVVVDQGKVFVSSSFIAACESLGVSVQPAPPGNGPAKGHVERTFSSINTLFVQHVAAYTASYTGERGKGAQGEAVWTLAQLDELLQEWIICGWQEREHDGLRHPMMPRLPLSPNEMWAALVAVCGYVPVPLGREDYIELMPVKRQKINDYGIRIDYRLRPHGPQPLPRRALAGGGRPVGDPLQPARSRPGLGAPAEARSATRIWVGGGAVDPSHPGQRPVHRLHLAAHQAHRRPARRARPARTRPGARPARVAGTRRRRAGHPPGEGRRRPRPHRNRWCGVGDRVRPAAGGGSR